jgi:formylglycine-generating enzyme required for sulfatase activity
MHLLSRFSFSILMSVVVFSANHHVSFAQDAIQPAPTTAPPAAEVKPADTTEVPEGMVLVTAGPFTMGSNSGEGLITNDATPQQMVTLPAFYIDKTEVTNAEYKKFCDATGNPVPPHWKDGTYAEGQAQMPVRWVNWWEAQAYAAWKGKRLPTEAEWEKAARGTDGRVYPWGNQRAPENIVWDQKGPQPVGSRPGGASPYGALDMAGNVFEWVNDWYDAYPNSNAKVPQFGTTYKVIRGGAFDGAAHETKTYHRSVTRPSSRSEWIGFRCAQSVPVQ